VDHIQRSLCATVVQSHEIMIDGRAVDTNNKMRSKASVGKSESVGLMSGMGDPSAGQSKCERVTATLG